MREICFQGLETIRQYKQQVALWESDFEALPTEESARRALFQMLSNEEPLLRAEAARGLATLQAVEAIPTLIELLLDESEEVREGARAALDALHRGARED